MLRVARRVLRMATVAEIERFLLASLGDAARQAGDAGLPPGPPPGKGAS